MVASIATQIELFVIYLNLTSLLVNAAYNPMNFTGIITNANLTILHTVVLPF